MAKSFDDMREHLDYEYAMMQSSYNLFHAREVWDEFMLKNQAYFNNLYQVDFFVHARNLLNFGSYNDLMDEDESDEINEILIRIESQITTLTLEGRTMEEKIQPSDHGRIKELAEKVYGKTI